MKYTLIKGLLLALMLCAPMFLISEFVWRWPPIPIGLMYVLMWPLIIATLAGGKWILDQATKIFPKRRRDLIQILICSVFIMLVPIAIGISSLIKKEMDQDKGFVMCVFVGISVWLCLYSIQEWKIRKKKESDLRIKRKTH